MNKEDGPLSSATFTVDTLVDFIEAFSRMFKIGIYYPVGHAVLNQSANNCIKQLRDISPFLASVKIEVVRHGLLVETREISDTAASVKELHKFLQNLGIKSIEFQRTIPHEQFLSFIKSLLAWRRQLESAQNFINFNVCDLPNSIKIEQQEFLVDETFIEKGGGVADFQQNLEELYLSLAEQGLNKQQVDQCKDLLEKLARPQGGKKTEIVGFQNASWHDVQTLLYNIITGAYSQDEGRFQDVATHDINAITSIFESLESSLTDKKSKEAIELLISHLTGSRKEQSEKPKKTVRTQKPRYQAAQVGKMISVEELKDFIFENNISLKVLEKITSVDRSEQMSIIFQLLVPQQAGQLEDILKQRLKLILSTRLTSRERKVFVSGIKYLADGEDVETFRRLFAWSLSVLRDSRELNSFDFIVEIWSEISSGVHIVLWPLVVNELLVVGLGEEKGNWLEVTKIASRMHPDAMRSLRFELEELEVFQDENVAPLIFCPSGKHTYRFFAILLETSLGTVIGEKVLEALQKEPQDTFFEAVGPLVDLAVPSHLQFLSSYLINAHFKEPPLALKMAAGEIVLEFLQNLSEDQKNLPWLSKTIASTSDLYVKGMKTMLGRIVKEKKMGVVPAWPKSCRKVAEGSLRALRGISLTELL